MGIFHKKFENKKEIMYKVILAKISNPLMDKIDAIEEREVRDFFKIILDAAERSLRGILFMAPEEFNFKKQITKEEIDFWLSKVSLALMSYSYYFYGDSSEIKKIRIFNFVSKSLIDSGAYWQKMFDYYNQIFNENIGQKEIDHYASGLKEDVEKGYSESGGMEKVNELTTRDSKTITSELLQKIWKENINSNERKGLFLGMRIWQAHQQIVQPFLAKFLREY
ncbi:MAG: hypothetical protein AUJ70_01635 [Candidatus Omnitrophica bacterium CG1_02_40_15]|nr:MAG: hypothetical protein AUJ70_01635 [Candidatus Omnitrophica bacterium CG1_02_40_15]